MPPPTVTNSFGATNITYDSARLNGNLTFDSGERTRIVIYWGDHEGGITNLYGVWGIPVNYGVFGSRVRVVFAVGERGTILRYIGNRWSKMKSYTTSSLHGVWGSSARNVFAVGTGGTILRYNGNRWSKMKSYTKDSLYAVWGSSRNNVFAVGENGTILRYNGNARNEWSRIISPTTDFALYAVWGSSRNNVFAVGERGTILRYNGSTWRGWPWPKYRGRRVITGHPAHPLYAVWGSSDDDVFAVGLYSIILHYDGNERNEWSEKRSPTQASYLYAVWGSSANDVFAVGPGGFILHYDGSAWSRIISPTTDTLFGVWGSSANDVFAVGGGGTILHYAGSAWRAMAGWDHRQYLGMQRAETFSLPISGLTPNTRYYYRCYAYNSFGSDWADSTASFIAAPPLRITTTSLANGTVGTDYSEQLEATGGTPPYTWSISAGSLPAELNLNTNTGDISGTPTAAGTANFTAMVTDSASATDTQALSITTLNPSKLLGADDDLSGSAGAANYFCLTRFRADADGTMNQFRVKSGVSGNVKYAVAIYTDNGGEPGAFIDATKGERVMTGGEWNIISFPPTTIARGTDYWLAICCDTPGAHQYVSGGTGRHKAATCSTYTLPNPADADGVFTLGAYTRLTAGWGI